MIRARRILLGLMGFSLLFGGLLYLKEEKEGDSLSQASPIESPDQFVSNVSGGSRDPSGLGREGVPGGGICMKKSDQLLLNNEASCDIQTDKVFPKLKFDPEWMDKREYWNVKFEKRYSERRALWSKLPLKVFILPHSHNDPGWLKTVEAYFATATHKILDLAVDKLNKYPNMTFIWTEVSLLHLWWSGATPNSRDRLRSLISSGRFEIATGGWVMPDEASSTLYSLLDQLIEGHSWLQNTLGVKPSISWSIDPFGHGSTLPYILEGSGLSGHMIMRIHYAWKEWFARTQAGDFIWKQAWQPPGQGLLTHNFPYDIYSIKGSCGPHASVCLEYNFRRIPGEIGEARAVPLSPANIRQRAERLLEQYGKTGSLYPHNVVLVPLGDDFTYSEGIEWEQQYSNYQKLINVINSDPSYNAEVNFGTLSDYFHAVRERMSGFKSLCGDFFPYADVFSEGRPAYWTGYYSSRPRMKALAREFESVLREAEILFSLCYNVARLSADDAGIEGLQGLYGGSLVPGRRALALFQHHDALTGTAKQYVMNDYEKKLQKSLRELKGLRRSALKIFLKDQWPMEEGGGGLGGEEQGRRDLLIFNSHGQTVEDVISVQIPSRNQGGGIRVLDLSDGSTLKSIQVSPVFRPGHGEFESKVIELSFFVNISGLSLKKYRILRGDYPEQKRTRVIGGGGDSLVNKSSSGFMSHFAIEALKSGDVSLENSVYQLIFSSGGTGFLRSLKHKPSGVSDNLEIFFGKYLTSQFRSGAYLFKPAPGESLEDMFDPDKEGPALLRIVSGEVYSEISLFLSLPLEENETLGAPYGPEGRPGTFRHRVRLYHGSSESPLSRGVQITNDLDLGGSLLHRDIDVFMRISSELIDNGGSPVLYSDSSGLSMTRRVRTDSLGPEGNYWPLTSGVYIEDEDSRLTLLTDHSQGVSGPETGTLEVMMDRRSSYDDSRGMGEGVLDSRDTRHAYWLVFEPVSRGEDGLGLPARLPALSPLALDLSRRLRYPLSTFVLPASPKSPFKEISFLSKKELCGAQILNFRTSSQAGTTPGDIPEGSALLILHFPGPDCGFQGIPGCSMSEMSPLQEEGLFREDLLKTPRVKKVSLTGTRDVKERGASGAAAAKGLVAYKINF